MAEVIALMIGFLVLGTKEGYSQIVCDSEGRNSTYNETLVSVTGSSNGHSWQETRSIDASGCPNHWANCVGKDGPRCRDTETQAEFQDWHFDIPAYPCIANNPTNVSCSAGPIGILLNGVPIYSATGVPPACGNAPANEGGSFDHCGGHAGGRRGIYHVHIPPLCLLNQINGNPVKLNGDTSENVYSHTHQIGWAMDGFPIYGPHGQSNNPLYQCDHPLADPNDCLDGCNGHSQHEIDGFTYHYHLNGPIGDGFTNPYTPLNNLDDFYPYGMGCFRGVIYDWTQVRANPRPRPRCSAPGTIATYTAAKKEGVTEPYHPVYDTEPPTPITLGPSISPTVSV